MTAPITTPQILARLGAFRDDLRPFTVMTVPFPKRETVRDPLWTGYFIMPHVEKLNDLHGRTMVNIISGETFHIYDKYSSRLPKPAGWLPLRTMEDEINRTLSRAESKFCDPNGGVCTPRTVGRAQAKKSSNKRLSRQSGVARSAIMSFKKGRNTIKPLTLRKLTKAIHHLQNKTTNLKLSEGDNHS